MVLVDEDSSKIICKLTNQKVWDEFNAHGTEMIITKNGRCMFPIVKTMITGLHPLEMYDLWIEFDARDSFRYKFNKPNGWARAGPSDSRSSQVISKHPDSPNIGSFWMSQEINFKHVKLTNRFDAPAGQIVLNSMHMYQPVIKITKSPTTANVIYPLIIKELILPELVFMAVTAYQNKEITQLKINYNPFAKGFRVGGKASKKRKRKSSRISENSSITDDDQIRTAAPEGCTDSLPIENDAPAMSSEVNDEDTKTDRSSIFIDVTSIEPDNLEPPVPTTSQESSFPVAIRSVPTTSHESSFPVAIRSDSCRTVDYVVSPLPSATPPRPTTYFQPTDNASSMIDFSYLRSYNTPRYSIFPYFTRNTLPYYYNYPILYYDSLLRMNQYQYNSSGIYMPIPRRAFDYVLPW